MPRKPALTLEQKELLMKQGGTVPAEEKKGEYHTIYSNGFTTVVATGGGKVPAVLSGQYTSTTRAEKAIADYLRERDASASR